MAQITSGIRSILARSGVYMLLQNLLARPERRSFFIDHYIAARPGDRILDVGCGPAMILNWLPKVSYLGVDLNPIYIQDARARFGDRGTFLVQDVRSLDLQTHANYTVVLALSLLHHLDDDEGMGLLAELQRRMAPGARLITIDPARVPGQHWLARFLIERDRGRNVRQPEEYAALARRVFARVELFEHDDMMRVPYNHAVLTCHRT